MERDEKSRREKEEIHWVPEKNMVTGFTFKGFFYLLILLIIGSVIKYLFF